MLNIFWFRKDLRITDNKGLSEFVKKNSAEDEYLFLYIKNKNTYKYFGEKRIGFLTDCLSELKEELHKSGFTLQIIEGKSVDVFRKITEIYKNVSVYCNEQVEPYCKGRDNGVKEILENCGGRFFTYTDTTLFPLGDIKNGDGVQYKIYTPFKNQCLKLITAGLYRKTETGLNSLSADKEVRLKGFIDFRTESGTYNSSDIIRGGRKTGIGLLKDFYENGLDEYKSKRDLPGIKGTSLLSAHLHFGTVGIREAFRTAFIKLNKSKEEHKRTEVQTWINELLWREFYYNITFHNPQIIYESFKPEYDKVIWNNDNDLFNKWCEGQTGYPIVDAGMRQLNLEGWMHNRLRMITAMFLTKDLMMDWRLGEKYFAENLIDLDFSSNNGGWQWSASTGVDAQPYFRIFNPYLQSKKFDTEGKYIRKYVPELKSLPSEYIHEPGIMSLNEQKQYGVMIGNDYPSPVVDHFESKVESIKRFKDILNHYSND